MCCSHVKEKMRCASGACCDGGTPSRPKRRERPAGCLAVQTALSPAERGSVRPSQQDSTMTLETYAPGANGLLVNVSGDWAASPPGNRAEVLPVRHGPGCQAGRLSVYVVPEYPYSV